MAKLTDIQVKNAKAKDKKYALTDGEGLSLVINPNATKIWRFRFMIDRKNYETTFKSYPSVSLKEARAKKDEYRDLINSGINPIEHFKQLELESIRQLKGLFDDVMVEWLETTQKERLKPSSYHTKCNTLKRDALKVFKGRYIDEITKDDLVELIQSKENRAPEIARKLRGYLTEL